MGQSWKLFIPSCDMVEQVVLETFCFSKALRVLRQLYCTVLERLNFAGKHTLIVMQALPLAGLYWETSLSSS